MSKAINLRLQGYEGFIVISLRPRSRLLSRKAKKANCRLSKTNTRCPKMICLCCVAHVVAGAKKFDHVKPILESSDWLPNSSRREFKIALLTYTCCNGLAPQYLADLLVLYNSTRQPRSSNKSMWKTNNEDKNLWKQNVYVCGTNTMESTSRKFLKKQQC